MMETDRTVQLILMHAYDDIPLRDVLGPAASASGLPENAELPVWYRATRHTERFRDIEQLRNAKIGELHSVWGKDGMRVADMLKLAGLREDDPSRGAISNLTAHAAALAGKILTGKYDAFTLGELAGISGFTGPRHPFTPSKISTRSWKRMERLGIKTAEDLANMNIGTLRNAPGIGATSLTEMIKLLEPLSGHHSADRAQMMQQFGDVFDVDAMALFSKRSEAARQLAAALRDFADETVRRRNIIAVQGSLDIRVLCAPAGAFLTAVGIAKGMDAAVWDRQIALCGDGAAVQDYLQVLANSRQGDDTWLPWSLFDSFLTWLATNPEKELSILVEQLLESYAKTSRGRVQLILKERARGLTLEDVAGMLQLSRERIRQIESRAVRKFQNLCGQQCLEALAFLAARDGDGITLDDAALRACTGDTAECVYVLAAKGGVPCVVYLRSPGMYYISRSGRKAEDLERAARVCIDDLPEVISEDEAKRSLWDASGRAGLPIALLRWALRVRFTHRGAFWVRTASRSGAMYRYALSKCFPDGYRVRDGRSAREMRRYLRDTFGFESAITDNSVDDVVERLGVLSGRGLYKSVDNVFISADLLADIDAYIRDNQKEAVGYAELYAAFRDRLEAEGIADMDALHGLLTLNLTHYTTTRSAVLKNSGTSLGQVLDEFVSSLDVVDREAVLKHFPGMPRYTFDQYAARVRLVKAEDGTFRTLERLAIPEEMASEALRLLEEICRDRAVTEREVEQAFRVKLPRFVEYVNRTGPVRLMTVLRSLCSDCAVNVARGYAAPSGLETTKEEIVLQKLGWPESIDFGVLQRTRRELGLTSYSYSRRAVQLVPKYYSVNGTDFVRADVVGITENVSDEVRNTVRKLVAEEGYVSAQKVAWRTDLPVINTDWTEALVEGAVWKDSRTSEIPYLLIPYNALRPWCLVFVDRQYDDPAEFLDAVLLDACDRGVIKSSNDVRTFLKEQGMYPLGESTFLEETIGRITRARRLSDPPAESASGQHAPPG